MKKLFDMSYFKSHAPIGDRLRIDTRVRLEQLLICFAEISHTVWIFFCQHLVDIFLFSALSNIFVKCVFHKSLTKSSTKCRSVIRSSLAQSLPQSLAQSLPQSLLRSVDRVFDQFVINVSVKSLNRPSTKISLRGCQRNICTKLCKHVCDILTKTSTHSYISEKV